MRSVLYVTHSCRCFKGLQGWGSVALCAGGRALEEMFLCYGARIGYWRGKIEGVQDDLHVSPFLKAVKNTYHQIDWTAISALVPAARKWLVNERTALVIALCL